MSPNNDYVLATTLLGATEHHAPLEPQNTPSSKQRLEFQNKSQPRVPLLEAPWTPHFPLKQ